MEGSQDARHTDRENSAIERGTGSSAERSPESTSGLVKNETIVFPIDGYSFDGISASSTDDLENAEASFRAPSGIQESAPSRDPTIEKFEQIVDEPDDICSHDEGSKFTGGRVETSTRSGDSLWNLVSTSFGRGIRISSKFRTVRTLGDRACGSTPTRRIMCRRTRLHDSSMSLSCSYKRYAPGLARPGEPLSRDVNARYLQGLFKDTYSKRNGCT